MLVDPLSALLPAIRKADGQLTAELREAYVKWAEIEVLLELESAGQRVPADCLQEVRADATLRDAVFAAVYPPDPSIVQNYARLRAALGPQFMGKYRSLVLAGAVNHRIEDVARTPVPGVDSPPVVKPEPAGVDDALAAGVADFLTQKKVTALAVSQENALQQQLADFLQQRRLAPSLIDQVRDPDKLHEALKAAMVRLGQRPAHREVPADLVTWFRYLATIYETRIPAAQDAKGQDLPWPRFPIDKAPWPLLMPLCDPQPLGEARYIWERYQGKFGADRYHLYGPYQHAEKVWPLELQPMPWHWKACPAQIVQGGICGVMANVARRTHQSLGEPAVGAGQPGHACLITYYCVDGVWAGRVEQSFAGGPSETRGDWPLRDGAGPRRVVHPTVVAAGAEYHLGLALGMNGGLREYLDTRIAVHLYGLLPQGVQQTLGQKLLRQAVQTDPLNPEPWYLLAGECRDAVAGLALVQAVQEKARSAPEADVPDDRDPDQSLEQFLEADHAIPVKKQLAAYWHTVEDYVTRQAVLDHAVPVAEVDARRVTGVLKEQIARKMPFEPGIVPYRVRFEGAAAVKASLEEDVRRHVAARRADKRRANERFIGELSALLPLLAPVDRPVFVASLIRMFPPDVTDKDDRWLKALHAASEPKKGKGKR